MNNDHYISLLTKYSKFIDNKAINFDKFNWFSIVHHSNAIEGSTLTLEETFLLLDEKLTPKNKPLEHSLMAVNHLDALKFVIQFADSKKTLSVKDINTIGGLVKKDTGSIVSTINGNFDSASGEFRKNSVTVGNRLFANADKVPNQVDDLVKYINQEVIDCQEGRSLQKIYNLSFDAHYQLVSIHPFADGNGRASRLLMNYIQSFFDVPLSRLFIEDKQDYFDALEKTRKTENIEIFRSFMFKQLEKHVGNEIKMNTKKTKSLNKI